MIMEWLSAKLRRWPFLFGGSRRRHHHNANANAAFTSIVLPNDASHSPPSPSHSYSHTSADRNCHHHRPGALAAESTAASAAPSTASCSESSPNPLMRQPYMKHPHPTKDKATNTKPRVAATVAMRLRFILHQLDTGGLSPEDLRKNLEYAAVVLETAYVDDHRRILDEDEEDEEFVPNEMPVEVREWLASTFTQQTKKGHKFKFKSVANAIRSGIVFDKIFRRISISPQVHIPSEVCELLKDISSWDFDVFRLNDVSDNRALKYLGLDLFHKYGLLTRFKIAVSSLESFLNHLEGGYSKHNNPYHNLVHAADVTQTTHFMISQTGLLECLNELEIFACLFAAMIHDFEHTGHTNNFHVQSLSDFALLYNDRSILENHHVSAVFQFMRDDPDSNILSSLPKDEFREFRSLVIEIVLSTDMSTHYTQIKVAKAMIAQPEGIEKQKALSLIVHCCDISHPAKIWPLHYRWTMSVLEEFFRQGDLEVSLGLPYSPLCDRHSTHVAESQIGFIDFIVEPTMVVCGEMLTKLLEPLVAMSSSLEGSSSCSNNSNDGSRLSSPDHNCLSPRTFRRLPMSADGKLLMPQPYLKILTDNKLKWREQARLGM